MNEFVTASPVSGSQMSERIGQLLAATRQTANQFAKSADISPASLYNFLNGRSYPSKATIEKILSAYAWISREWLVMGIGSMQNEQTARQANAPSDIKKGVVTQGENTSANEASLLHVQLSLMQQIIQGRDREIAHLEEIITLLREKLSTNESLEISIVEDRPILTR